MILFLKIIFIVYAVLILFLLYGWFRNNTKTKTSNFKLSVVIAVRNEEKNIGKLISNLKLQDYNPNLFNVIVIDDHSEDQTLKLLKKESAMWKNLKVLSLEKKYKGKKQAILKGVKFSNSDIIITTDADCSFTHKWLTSISSYFISEKINLVSAPVSYNTSSNFFSKLQTVEFLSLIASAAGAIGINKPILCNGANLAYRRKVFMEKNQYSTDDKASGDDVFLLHNIKQFYNHSILFAKNLDALVLTDPKKNFTDFFNQRLRWSSKSVYYRDFDTIFVSMLVFVTNLLVVISAICLMFESIYTDELISMIVLKFIVDFIFLVPILFFFNRTSLIGLIPILQFFYPIYITLTSIISTFVSFNWKGRIEKS